MQMWNKTKNKVFFVVVAAVVCHLFGKGKKDQFPLNYRMDHGESVKSFRLILYLSTHSSIYQSIYRRRRRRRRKRFILDQSE